MKSDYNDKNDFIQGLTYYDSNKKFIFNFLLISIIIIIVIVSVYYNEIKTKVIDIYYEIAQPSLYFKKGEIFYTPNVTKKEVIKLGNYLIKINYFSDKKRVSVKLDKKDNIYHMYVVIDKRYRYSISLINGWKFIGSLIRKFVFNNKPLIIFFTDEYMKILRKIEPYNFYTDNKYINIFYTNNIPFSKIKKLRKKLSLLNLSINGFLILKFNIYKLYIIVDNNKINFSPEELGKNIIDLFYPLKIYICKNFDISKNKRIFTSK